MLFVILSGRGNFCWTANPWHQSEQKITKNKREGCLWTWVIGTGPHWHMIMCCFMCATEKVEIRNHPEQAGCCWWCCQAEEIFEKVEIRNYPEQGGCCWWCCQGERSRPTASSPPPWPSSPPLVWWEHILNLKFRIRNASNPKSEPGTLDPRCVGWKHEQGTNGRTNEWRDYSILRGWKHLTLADDRGWWKPDVVLNKVENCLLPHPVEWTKPMQTNLSLWYRYDQMIKIVLIKSCLWQDIIKILQFNVLWMK